VFLCLREGIDGHGVLQEFDPQIAKIFADEKMGNASGEGSGLKTAFHKYGPVLASALFGEAGFKPPLRLLFRYFYRNDERSTPK